MKYLLLAVLLVFLVPLLRRIGKKPEEPEAKPLPRKPERERIAASEDEDADPARAKAAADARFQELLRTVVVLEGNDWSACTIDGMREAWARFTAKDVAGFTAIPAGRHRVVTRIGDRDATLDFVLLPGEVLARRLDRDACEWRELDANALASVTARARGGEKGVLGEALVSYRSTMGIARTQSKSTRSVASPDAVVARVIDGLAALVTESGDESDDDARVAKAKTLGEELIGVPLTRAQIDTIANAVKRPRIAEAVLPGFTRAAPTS